jgi:uncharacterized glyoxalase superfamily protein PhnB
MLANRSIPYADIIPVLAYADVNRASAWLCEAFGFSVRVRIGAHRVQMNANRAAVIVREYPPGEEGAQLGLGVTIMFRVEDADAHCERARAHGAEITAEPCTYPYGERQYSVKDFAGYSWTFSQSVADVDPAEWGGVCDRL